MKLNGSIIKAILFQRRIRQWQLAKALNLPEVYMSQLILGKIVPSEKLINKMAKVLKVKPEVIIEQNKVEISS